MDISFPEADLAALCNSERMLADRWSPDCGRNIGRRLLELGAAADLAVVKTLPGAIVEQRVDDTVAICFQPGSIEVIGVLLDSLPPGRKRSQPQPFRVLSVTANVAEGSRTR